MTALLLALAASLARAEPGKTVWGVRGGVVETTGAMDKYFGRGLATVEGYGDFKLAERADLEIAAAGWVGSSVENGTAVNGALVTPYHFRQTVSVVPVLFTLGTGTYNEKYNLRVGAGLGVYTVKLDRAMTFDDGPTQASFGQVATKTTATVGPHLQLAFEAFVARNLAATFLARYAYARVNESASRFFRSGTGTSLSFFESDRLGNVAGFTLAWGLSLRL